MRSFPESLEIACYDLIASLLRSHGDLTCATLPFDSEKIFCRPMLVSLHISCLCTYIRKEYLLDTNQLIAILKIYLQYLLILQNTFTNMYNLHTCSYTISGLHQMINLNVNTQQLTILNIKWVPCIFAATYNGIQEDVSNKTSV